MKKVKLGEVVTLKKGKKATILNEQTILSQRYIQIDDLRNDNNLKFTESLNMTEALLDDILIAWDGANAGTIGYGLSGAVGSTIMVLKKNEQYKDEIISDYLGVFLESKSQYLRYHSTGATIPHLNKNILLDLKLELLHIEEQENIIRILNIIKRLITKRKCQLEELNLLVKSRFNEMFGDIFDTTFPIYRLEELCEFIKDGTHQTPQYTDDRTNGFKFLSSKDVTSGKISWDNIKYITESLHNELYSKISPRRNDILLAKNGTTGIAALVDCDEIFDIYVSLAILRFYDGNNPTYLLYAINSDFTKWQFESKIKGVGVPNLHLGEIRKTKIPLPPLSLQNEFADFVAQVDKSQLAIQKSLEELETLKKSLMQEYFG
ncbi:restriction endonuclease subunit S [Streptococcus oralis]|uniref:restriction endonuclease subunit S n=1 Tax=Streptococcus oralis TaxID=1303 RepID=UPI0004593168|nr:restriction endonuclease subunit S [Streptococcus oralis]MBN6011256.1 restriction endonuclease subunit S [Streptococcus oralis subsp. oralis]